MLRVRGFSWRGAVILTGWLVALLVACWGVGLLPLAPAAPAPAAAAPDPARIRAPGIAVLESRRSAVDVWPVLSVLTEPAARWQLPDVLARLSERRSPAVPVSNFGEFAGVVWLVWDVLVEPEAVGDWLLDVGYPALDHVDLYLLREGQPVQLVRNGDRLRLSERPMPTRTHVMPLALSAGRYLMVLRVETSGSMIVPVRLMTPQLRQFGEERTQVLQGLANGVMLSLLIYSLAQGYSLRDRMFAYYAVGVGGVGLFQVTFMGIGLQHLWGEALAVSELLPPVCILVGVLGAFLFIDRALEIRQISPRLSLAMRVGALLCVVSLLLLVSGVITYRDGQQVAKVLGQFPTILALPVAWRRWRQGDRAAGYILVGWGIYTAGVVVLALLISGRIPATPVTLHLFQVASLIEMVMWVVVMGIRVDTLRRSAERDRLDGERLRHLADTDALTGVLNRRGLQAAAESLLQQAQADRLAALYLLDLDGFKPVNDRLGHHAGDAVLIEIATRLGTQLRPGDLVARIGGDEFVVVVTGLRDEEMARQVGDKLLVSMHKPITLQGSDCTVGATIGYALAPTDSRDLGALLGLADQAMYAGKQAGRRQVRRAWAPLETGPAPAPRSRPDCAQSC
ncbi:diguanylate cyclase [Sphaerotilus sp.]|uniref:diguanylate cyclase n=1 Tax=Sphaerotilus sp. TaxID=2093942 RepID=UPI002ACDDB8C|nr:diguanylate cyclase [Sphaerotilus sp.]MDZ7856655.1 diguanylate cyclase [Sphaerotilus sp.]